MRAWTFALLLVSTAAQLNPDCSWTSPAGGRYDLSPLRRLTNDYRGMLGAEFTTTLNICAPQSLRSSSCAGSMACLFRDRSPPEVVASLGSYDWSAGQPKVEEREDGLTLFFDNGTPCFLPAQTPREVFVNLKCGREAENNFTIEEDSDPTVCRFRITLKTPYVCNLSFLQPNDPIQGEVERWNMSTFLLSTATAPVFQRHVTLTLKQLTGECFLYARVNQLPTISEFTWTNQTARTYEKQLVITNAPPNALIHIGVYGFTACRFSLVASTTGLQPIEEGVHVGGLVLPRAASYFQFRVPPNIVTLELMMRTWRGNVSMYLSRDLLPSPTSFTWEGPADAPAYACIVINRPPEGDYFHGVFGFGLTGPNEFSSQFLLNGRGDCSGSLRLDS